MAVNIIRAAIEGNEIVIRVPIDAFVGIVENDPEYQYKVIDKNKFAKEIVFEINEGATLCNEHTGIRDIERLFQDAYEAVAQQGDDEIMTSEERDFTK